MQTVFPGSARGKQSVKLLFQTVTRLWDRACHGWWAVRGDSEGNGGKCKAVGGVGGSVSYRESTNNKIAIPMDTYVRATVSDYVYYLSPFLAVFCMGV